MKLTKNILKEIIGNELLKNIVKKTKSKKMLKEWNDTSFKSLPKRWSKKVFDGKTGLTEFEQEGGKDYIKEDKMNIGRGKYANLYKIKEDMKEGKFDPKNPQIHLIGLGVYNLKTLEKVIKRDLINSAKDLGYESGAKNLNYHLYKKHSPLGSKIQGLWEVYQQMNNSQYKRAVTMYKKKR